MTNTLSGKSAGKRRLTPLASALALTLMSGLTASASASFNPIISMVGTVPKTLSANVLMPSPAGDVAYYTIVLKDAPVATYAGELAGLPPPDRLIRGATTGKLDLNSPATQAYVSYLQTRQDAFVADIGATFGRQLSVMARMQHALNAVIVGLSSEEATELSKRPDVLIVEREHELELHTDNGPTFIGAPAIWGGSTASGASTQGEGIIVGIIDTGVNWQSPAFAAVGPIDGYVHQNPDGAGNYRGLCVAPFADVGRCNDKLIGIYNFASTSPTRSGVDTQGHGSHTASTVAGNRWQATYASGDFIVSGVAPHANVIAYLACPTTSCPTTATTQSANQAVIDGVDVINFSIGGGTSPWTDTTSVAFRNANAAGMFIAASAGNTSTAIPNPQGQVNHLEPWVQTVAASTQDRIIAVSLDLTSEVSPPPNTQDIPMRPGGSPLPTASLIDVPLIKSPNFANGLTDGCSPYPAGTFTRTGAPADRIFADGFDDTPLPPITQGAVAALHLDSTASACASGARRTAALNAGAIGVIFVDVAYLNLGAADTSWSMLRSDWDNLEAAYNPATATVSIDINAAAFPAQADVIAGFSFRGPRLVGGQGMVKPDITGPGVDILASGAAPVVGANGVYLSNGTSMSSPHMAGAAALMRALNPTWTAPQIKSALNLSSNNFGAINQDGSPVRLWDYGSGRVNLAAASKVGLIMDETPANFLAANPATGGEISSLNLASIAKYNAVGSTVFTRTVRRARSGTQTYNLSATGFPPGAISVSPTSFTINASGTRVITVTVQSGLLTEGEWTLGEVAITPAGGDEPNLHMPVAIYPGGPQIAVSPTSLSGSSDTTVSNNLTISNIANPTLNWTVQTTGNGVVTPFNTTSTSNGWQGGRYLGFVPERGYYWSQNFDVDAAMRVTTLRANGFTLPSTPALSATTTPSITFSVYADNAGEPAGAPEGFGAAPLWTFTGAIGAANGITTTGGALSLNLNATNVVGTPLNLTSGRYWMTIAPSINGTGAQTAASPLWAWFVSGDAPIGNAPKLYAPWSDPSQFSTPAGLTMLSGFVQGTVDCNLPAWVGLTTTAGSLGFAGSQVIPVEFNATGLPAGTYTGNLCISSNATNFPLLPVPLTFTVPTGGSMAPTISKAFAPTSVEANTPSTLTITLANSGGVASTLSADLVDTFPSGLVVAATPNSSTTCASGTVLASAGGGSVTLQTGAVIPATGNCTVSVDVTSAAADDYDNVIAIGALQTSTGNNAAAANATLTVTPVVVLACTTGDEVEVEATAGTTGPSGYTTLKGAFDAINAGTHQGVVDIAICDDTTETDSAVLNASGTGSAVYTAATITPAGGAARTVSGAIAAGSPLIDLAGADNVTIDGLNSGGNALTLSNTTVANTAGTSTIRFINGATGNTVTRTTVLGSSTTLMANAGGTILFSTSTEAGGNSDNTISLNSIGPAGSNLPSKGVYALGSASPNHNVDNVIDGNNVFDFFLPTGTGGTAGISTQVNNDNTTISNNRIYQTAPRTFTGAVGIRYSGILINSATYTNNVTGNVIGFGAADGTGTTTITGTGTGLGNEVRGIIYTNARTTPPFSTVSGNTVSGINQTTNRNATSSTTAETASFVGIHSGSSADAPANIVGNTIGSQDGSSTIVINAGSTTANTAPVTAILNYNWLSGVSIANNNIGSITINNNAGTGTATSFRGIFVSATTGVLHSVTDNVIGGPTPAGGITSNLVGANSAFAIHFVAASGTVTGNTVRNITNNANNAAVVLSGIFMSGSNAVNPNTVAGNTVHSLRNIVTGGAGGATYAIDLAISTNPASVVEKNLVHSITADTTLTTYQIIGLFMRNTGGSAASVRNNMVRLGLDPAGASITTALFITGIRDAAVAGATNNFYHNSVYIGGSNVAPTGSNTYAFNSDSITTTRNFQNNIFWNARSNIGTGGTAHVAIRVGGTAPNPPGLTSNYNVILANGNDGVTGVFNAAIVPTLLDWQTATGQDANSFAANPQYIAPDGDAATGDLHISPVNPTPIEGTGTPIASVTDDFDGQDRSGLTPTDIGADAGNFVP